MDPRLFLIILLMMSVSVITLAGTVTATDTIADANGVGDANESFTFVHMTDAHIGYYDIKELTDDPRICKLIKAVDPKSMVESVVKFTDTLQDIKTHNPDFILDTGDLVESNNLDFFNAYAEIHLIGNNTHS
ncbi:MAG: hypothetical protein U9O90_03385 [Euryarchaeota archaeon]|nr:hypothetical protein [Euryarchaeota archaeon]